MKTLLQLNSSLYSNEGQSSRLAGQFVAAWQSANPGGVVLVRDLAREPVPHLTAERFGAFAAAPNERTAAQQAAVDYSDALISELKSADVIVLGLPFYNFGVPSTLKAYFDHVARVGVTFKYTEAGAVGLLAGRQAYVFAARGGVYAGTAGDTQTAYVRQFLGFLGIEEVAIVYAEGLALGAACKETALSRARAEVESLTRHDFRAAA